MTDIAMAPTPDPITADGLRRGFAATAIAVTGVVGLLVAIWGLAGGGYFWPIWVATGLGLPLAILGWITWVFQDPAVRQRVGLGFTISAGIYGAVVGYLVLVWACSGAGYFWPVWPALGFGTVLLVHYAVVRFVGPRAEMTERIETLTVTRTAAINAQEAELRRIERDLHDGAQARLVALGMTIGMAEQKLTTDPEGARQLLAEARGGATEALVELRDLARGIHPPVLQDRGLAAAVRELAVRSPLDVHVTSDTDRLPPAVESAAYFVVAEALANAGKHADPSRIDISIQRNGGTLAVEVVDDGRGGANPEGGGLSGLRKRVEALDGSLRVASPVGGPTVIRAEMPCAL
jgi:signal transduction histidine kinase